MMVLFKRMGVKTSLRPDLLYNACSCICSICLNLDLGVVHVLADEYVEPPEGQKQWEENIKKRAWESLCATLSEIHAQPLEKKN